MTNLWLNNKKDFMTKKHIWRIKRIYFDQLKSGKKTLEIRVGYPQIKKAQKGDIITFENYGFNEFDVKDVRIYQTIAEMLDTEGVEKVLPGLTHGAALHTLQRIYPKDREKLGVYVLELIFKTNRFRPKKYKRAWNLPSNQKTKKKSLRLFFSLKEF